eukprot:NODE_161_length_16629_cov_0.427344.p9 type:complete len:144 gc:universal NODE_161_length_16629_cov_0.427344:756-325(-)
MNVPLGSIIWMEVPHIELEEQNKRIMEWANFPVHMASKAIEKYLPSKYMNISLALLWIWHSIEGNIKSGLVYGIDLVRDGCTISEFRSYLASQFILCTEISSKRNVEILCSYHKLSSLFTQIEFKTAKIEDLDTESLISDMSS